MWRWRGDDAAAPAAARQARQGEGLHLLPPRRVRVDGEGCRARLLGAGRPDRVGAGPGRGVWRIAGLPGCLRPLAPPARPCAATRCAVPSTAPPLAGSGTAQMRTRRARAATSSESGYMASRSTVWRRLLTRKLRALRSGCVWRLTTPAATGLFGARARRRHGREAARRSR